MAWAKNVVWTAHPFGLFLFSKDRTCGIKDSWMESSKVSIRNCGGSETGGASDAQVQEGGWHDDGQEYPGNCATAKGKKEAIIKNNFIALNVRWMLRLSMFITGKQNCKMAPTSSAGDPSSSN